MSIVACIANFPAYKEEGGEGKQEPKNDGQEAGMVMATMKEGEEGGVVDVSIGYGGVQMERVSRMMAFQYNSFYYMSFKFLYIVLLTFSQTSSS